MCIYLSIRVIHCFHCCLLQLGCEGTVRPWSLVRSVRAHVVGIDSMTIVYPCLVVSDTVYFCVKVVFYCLGHERVVYYEFV